MTAKRKLFWRAVGLILAVDFAVHFYGQWQQILAWAYESEEGVFQLFMNSNALLVLAWNTFARTLETFTSAIGIIVIALMIVGYIATKPLPPTSKL